MVSTDAGAVAEAPLEAPRLRTARLEDYPKIRELGLAHSLDVPPYDDWSRLWIDNPLNAESGKNFPIGWILETSNGEIVGCMGTARSRYTFRGDDLISAVARAWFVPIAYRGFALELMDEYLNQPGIDLVINNAVSLAAHEMFRQFCKRLPLGRWDTISYWITNHRAFSERALNDAGSPLSESLAYPLAAGLWVKELVTGKPLPLRNSYAIESPDGFDATFEDFWHELVRQRPEKLLADRSLRALSWHYAIPRRKKRLWVLTAIRNGRMRAFCTLIRQDHAFRLPALPHADTQAIRSVRIIDYQAIDDEVDYLPGLLQAALRRCAKEDIYVLENLGRGVPKMRALDECAPYLKTLENWKFYYRASDPALDAELSRPAVWDPCAYDGDVSFE